MSLSPGSRTDTSTEDAAEKFDDLRLDQKIRKFLTRFDVSPSIPNSLPRLRQWDDGPKAVTEVRHAAVHAKRHSDGWSWDSEIWSEADSLCNWYATLGLLALINYDGRYINRTSATKQSDWSWVPWSTRSGDD